MIKIGEKYGNFLIKAEIGKGGMGTIYYAVDTMLEREVALKIIHPELAHNAQLMERFKIEAMTQARMNHPAIVMIFSFNKIDEEYIIAMEYVAGKSLKDLLVEKRMLPPVEAIHYVEQVLQGLQYAHGQNIIHRDIKPANILITTSGQVKLSDFGIAKVFGSHGLTKTGMLVGTPWYTSPEQILGRDIDFRSDLYSLGITFYEMLTGRVPFDSVTNSEFQIQKAHLETPPPRPSTFNPEINLRLEKFILKALQKSPEKRFQNAVEMLHELQRLKSDIIRITSVEERAAAAPRPTPEKPMRRGWFTPVRGAAVGVGVIALALAGWLLLRRPAPVPQPEPTPLANQMNGGQTPAEKPQGNVTPGGASGGADSQPQPGVQPEPSSSGTDARPVGGGDGQPTIEPRPKPAEKTGEPNLQPSTSKPVEEVVDDRAVEGEMNTALRIPTMQRLRAIEPRIDRMLASGRRLRPMAYRNAGHVKFMLEKFREAETCWAAVLQAGEQVVLPVMHLHENAVKACNGELRIRRERMVFNADNPEHSFRLTPSDVRRVTWRANAFEVMFELGGEKMVFRFALTLAGNREEKERFLVDFIHKYFIQAR